jgi:hypothetical protein
MQVAGRVAEHLVFGGVVARVAIGDAATQRLRPEIRGCVEVFDVAVDDETGEAAAVGYGGFSMPSFRRKPESSSFPIIDERAGPRPSPG